MARLIARSQRLLEAEDRKRNLDRLFGKTDPQAPVTSPSELWVEPELLEEVSSAENKEPQPLRVDDWHARHVSDADFARCFTGHSSPPDDFVRALSNSSNYLRVAISKQRHRPARRELKPRLIAVQKAAKEVLRFVRKKKPPHKAQAKQDKKWRAAMEDLGCLPHDPEVLYGLFLEQPIRFRCEDSEFIACLTIVDTVRNNPSKDPSAELASYEDRFIADLELIANLAEAYKSSLEKPLKNRMTATPTERAPHHGEEQRLKDARTWSPKLYCAAIVLAASAWSEPRFDWPYKKWEACEDLWIARGGPAHDGKNVDAHDVWNRYLNAAKRTVGGIWRLVERDFGPSPFRSFDEPVAIPERLRDKSVSWKGRKRTRTSCRVDVVTLQEAKNFIAERPESEREKKAWRDATWALDYALIGAKPPRFARGAKPTRFARGAKPTRFARGRFERALNTPDNPISAWYDPPLSNDARPQWVITVKNELREHLKTGLSDTVDELASKLGLQPALAEQLLHELAQEKSWSPL
jgi:hypothetical protein